MYIPKNTDELSEKFKTKKKKKSNVYHCEKSNAIYKQNIIK